jgi:hypothetical protein
VVKVWEEKVLPSGQMRVRFSRSKDGVICRGWTSLKSANGSRLLQRLHERH